MKVTHAFIVVLISCFVPESTSDLSQSDTEDDDDDDDEGNYVNQPQVSGDQNADGFSFFFFFLKQQPLSFYFFCPR